MKQIASVFPVLVTVGISIVLLLSGSGCANIIPPSGGARDSLPPVLIAENPMDSARNVTTRLFTFTFDEYVELQNTQDILVSPTPVKLATFNSKLRTVTVRLRDTLEANTTYSINFGNAIKDINEGNVLKDFSYVFSTGNAIDTFSLSGKVVTADASKLDTAKLVVVLHKNLDDSAVIKERPRYVARLDGQGNFIFKNVSPGTYRLYAVPNTFNFAYDESGPFAFADKPVVIGEARTPVNLYAYVEVPGTQTPTSTGAPRPSRDQNKILRFSTNLEAGSLDILNPLYVILDKKITIYDSNKIILTNKDFARQSNYSVKPDSAARRFSIVYNWIPGTEYNLVVAKDAFKDSTGATLAKADTIKFLTKREEDYGSVKLRFNNLDLNKNPVLLILENDAVVQSVPLTQRDFIQKRFKPGEYGLRILFDANKNGKWDSGEFFGKHKQPETVIKLGTTLSVRANWDNEPEITL